MATREQVPQNFKLEGSAAQLRCLMETIAEALKRAAQSTEPVAAQGNIGSLDIEVRVHNPDATLAVRPDSREE
ncbi:MAG TPA: hypothetical protein VKV03_00940, partial [Candidatus Binataceae bacterium]|nr:hypothetical protein [Candidatus Binataceae bacterium]